jgi:hypothetical protein
MNNMPYNPMMNAQQRLQQLEQQYPQYQQPLPNQQTVGIQGKIVSDFETVKATETPLDGSITYFPLVNGDYIYTKFLNMNTGSSDYAVYKKIVEEQQAEKNEEFDIKAYLDEKFETLKQELKGGTRNARKSSKSDSAETNE